MDRDSMGRHLGDVPLELTAELGRVALSLERARRLRPGDVLRWGKLAGEPFDVRVNGVLVAFGETVLCGAGRDGRAVRITSMAAPPAAREGEAI